MNINFGLKINELLEERKISKVQAAKMMGYTRKGFSDVIEKEDVNTGILKKICEVFDIPIEYFFEGNKTVTHQKGKANVIGGGNIQYKAKESAIGKDGDSNDVLRTENRYLKEQIALLKDTIEILKSRN